MEDFELAIRNRLYYDGGEIAVELDATEKDNYRWVVIYKLKASHPLSPMISNPFKYSVLDFELRKELVDEYFADSDMMKQKRYNVRSESELCSLLKEVGISPKQFTYPWKCNFPL